LCSQMHVKLTPHEEMKFTAFAVRF